MISASYPFGNNVIIFSANCLEKDSLRNEPTKTAIFVIFSTPLCMCFIILLYKTYSIKANSLLTTHSLLFFMHSWIPYLELHRNTALFPFYKESLKEHCTPFKAPA